MLARSPVAGSPEAPGPGTVGVDEKSITTRQTYVTIVYDIERASIEYIAEDRSLASLVPYFGSFCAQRA